MSLTISTLFSSQIIETIHLTGKMKRGF